MAGPTALLSAAIEVYHAASWTVINDEAIWQQEAASAEQRLLHWPRPAVGTQWDRLLSMLFNAEVDVMLARLRYYRHPLSPAWPPDVHDPALQVVLRVGQRGMEAGWEAVQREFGGIELTGWRNYRNRVHEALAAWARAAGVPGDAAGLGRRQAYRAEARARNRAGAKL